MGVFDDGSHDLSYIVFVEASAQQTLVVIRARNTTAFSKENYKHETRTSTSRIRIS